VDSIKLWINKARQAEIFKAGNAEALIEWYENGADGQIDWGQPGDFEQCVEIAGQYLENPEGFCQLRHIGATGEPSGHAEGEVSKADKPDYGKVISSRKGEPSDQDLYNRVKREAATKFDVYPSAVANGWVVQEYKRRGGKYHKSVEKAESMTPPKGVQEAAQQALEWMKDGKAGGGFTPVGRKRASDLANGHPVSMDTVKRMKAYFDRHQSDKDSPHWAEPSPGKVAWYAWGGDAGYSWAKGVVGSEIHKAGAENLLKAQATFHGNQYKDVASEGQQPTSGGGGPRRVDPGRYQVGGGRPAVGQPQPGGNTAPDNTSPLAGVKPNPSSSDVGEKVLKPADDTSKGMRQFAERVLTAINRGDQPVIDRKDLAKMFLGMRGGIDREFMKSDITELRIDGTRLMGRDGLGYGRKDMPQVETSQRDQFMADIKKSDGITHTKEDVDPTTLKPVQKEVFAVKSAGIFRSFQKTGIPDRMRILISKDGYVLDGHHTWAAAVAIHFLTGKSLPVYRLSVDHEEALAITTKWANENNAENQGQGKPEATKKSLDFSTDTLLREYMTLELEKAFFHGNQYKQGEGGGKAKPARQVDESRFQAVGRFGDKAEAVAQKPASDDHRALAKGHREAIATLQKMKDEETRPELKDSLQKAIDHHEHAANRHEQAANFHDDPNVDAKIKQGASETARDMSKLADHLTDKAQEAYAWAKPIFGHRRAA